MKIKHVIKADGERAIFDINKIIRALTRSGASIDKAKEIASTINLELEDDTSTKHIFKKAFRLLKKESRSVAARYNLKNAIMQLGDTGYPFEDYVGALLTAEGYNTAVGIIEQGQCVTHEIDVIATNNEEHIMCECKFHNKQGRICNIKIPLYIQSRFIDIGNAYKVSNKLIGLRHVGHIFTNTRFSSDAIQYASCVGLQLVSWDYPAGNSIRERIDRTGIHPVTCLVSLSNKEKSMLIKKGIITCKDLIDQVPILNNIGVSSNRAQKILTEAQEVCKSNNHE